MSDLSPTCVRMNYLLTLLRLAESPAIQRHARQERRFVSPLPTPFSPELSINPVSIAPAKTVPGESTRFPALLSNAILQRRLVAN